MNLLVFDFAGCGMSEGKYVTLGMFEVLDIDIVIKTVENRFPFTALCIWGRSMGAVAAMRYAENNPTKVGGLVLDSPFSDLHALASHIGNTKLGIPSLLMTVPLHFLSTKLKETVGEDLLTMKPMDSAKKLRLPVFFLTGKNDELLPQGCVSSMYKECPSSKKIMQYSEGDHNSEREFILVLAATDFLAEASKSYRLHHDKAASRFAGGHQLFQKSVSQSKYYDPFLEEKTRKIERSTTYNNFNSNLQTSQIRPTISARQEQGLSNVIIGGMLHTSQNKVEVFAPRSGRINNPLDASFDGKTLTRPTQHQHHLYKSSNNINFSTERSENSTFHNMSSSIIHNIDNSGILHQSSTRAHHNFPLGVHASSSIILSDTNRGQSSPLIMNGSHSALPFQSQTLNSKLSPLQMKLASPLQMQENIKTASNMMQPGFTTNQFNPTASASPLGNGVKQLLSLQLKNQQQASMYSAPKRVATNPNEVRNFTRPSILQPNVQPGTSFTFLPPQPSVPDRISGQNMQQGHIHMHKFNSMSIKPLQDRPTSPHSTTRPSSGVYRPFLANHNKENSFLRQSTSQQQHAQWQPQPTLPHSMLVQQVLHHIR